MLTRQHQGARGSHYGMADLARGCWQGEPHPEPLDLAALAPSLADKMSLKHPPVADITAGLALAGYCQLPNTEEQTAGVPLNQATKQTMDD